jgi:hypothetical protein
VWIVGARNDCRLARRKPEAARDLEQFELIVLDAKPVQQVDRTDLFAAQRFDLRDDLSEAVELDLFFLRVRRVVAAASISDAHRHQSSVRQKRRSEPALRASVCLMANGHRTAELRSIALHARVAAHLQREPELLERARACVAGWIADGGPVYLHTAARWQALLAKPLPEILSALVEDSEEMRDLRQSSPFAGVLSHEERVEAIRSVRRTTR